MQVKNLNRICTFLSIINYSFCYFDSAKDEDDCFCQLQGKIDDCTCNVDTVDHFNNIKIYPRLRNLLQKSYFRFYKVNLQRPCPFWSDDGRCAIRYCHVKPCEEKDIPTGLKGAITPAFEDHYSENMYISPSCEDHNAELGYLNTTISPKIQENIVLWSAYDDAQDNFCMVEDNTDDGSEYVDLLLNPERYTGYKGTSAHRIWNNIYMENCFRSTNTDNPYVQSSKLNSMCLEERAFYRAISGLHASINIHLCAQYLLSESLTEPHGKWGSNLNEFQRRFSKENTQGEGPHWLRNLYFVYLLELRALSKTSTFLQGEEFYTGNEAEDWDTQLAVKDLLTVVQQFPHHFNENNMFTLSEQARKLKDEFKQHFRNISKIMDCVGCDKCKLWGKLQVQGLGTALKILFSEKLIDRKLQFSPSIKRKFKLHRSEIVSLFNSIGRLSTSIYELDEFRHMLR